MNTSLYLYAKNYNKPGKNFKQGNNTDSFFSFYMLLLKMQYEKWVVAGQEWKSKT